MPEAVSYAPTGEMDLIRSTARSFLHDRLHLGVVRELMMSVEGFERGLWKEMCDLGWAGLAVPEEHGGAGYALVELSVVLEEMGKMVTPGPFFASVVLGTTALQETGTADQKARLLPGLVSGETIATVGLFEGPRGWDPYDVATTARRDGEGFSLNGVKRYVLDAAMADLVLVTARVDDGVGLFAVEATAPGVEVAPTPTLDPTRRQADVSLSDVMVGGSALLGEAPTNSLGRILGIATAALAVEQAGGAQRCLEMSVEYAKTRYQFGRPIGSYQAVKHRCAEMLMRVEHARSTAYHAVRVTEDPDELAIASPLAGSVCSEAYVWAAGESLQIHGGIGFTWEHDAHLYLKRAKASSLLFGDPRHHRRLLGDALGF